MSSEPNKIFFDTDSKNKPAVVDTACQDALKDATRVANEAAARSYYEGITDFASSGFLEAIGAQTKSANDIAVESAIGKAMQYSQTPIEIATYAANYGVTYIANYGRIFVNHLIEREDKT